MTPCAQPGGIHHFRAHEAGYHFCTACGQFDGPGISGIRPAYFVGDIPPEPIIPRSTSNPPAEGEHERLSSGDQVTESPGGGGGSEPETPGEPPIAPHHSPAAEDRGQQQAEAPGDGGAEGPGWRQELHRYMVAEDISMSEVGRRIGVSQQTVANWLNGVNQPSEHNLERLNELIAPDGPSFEPADDPETIGNLPRVPTYMQAAAYLQKTLAHWMRSQKLTHQAAADELGIDKRRLLEILQVILPTENLLKVITDRLPELRPDLPALLEARRMKDKSARAA